MTKMHSTSVSSSVSCTPLFLNWIVVRHYKLTFIEKKFIAAFARSYAATSLWVGYGSMEWFYLSREILANSIEINSAKH